MSKETDKLLISSALKGNARPMGFGISVEVKNEAGETLGTMPVEVASMQQLQRMAFALEAIAVLLEHVSVIVAPQGYAPQEEDTEGYPIDLDTAPQEVPILDAAMDEGYPNYDND